MQYLHFRFYANYFLLLYVYYEHVWTYIWVLSFTLEDSKKLEEDQCSAITKGSLYHIKHMYIQPFTTVEWPEIFCRYFIFTWRGRDDRTECSDSTTYLPMTLKLQVAVFPLWSLNVHITLVVPTGNCEKGWCEQTRDGVTPELSVAWGCGHETLTVLENGGRFALMSSGQKVTTGGIVSVGAVEKCYQ